MSKNVDEKKFIILEAAKKRFAHFGMAKTTMAEIAKDLSFSKALLYYYFPDKHSLYLAVLDFVIHDMNRQVDDFIDQTTDVKEALIFAVELRAQLIKENYNLFEYSSSLFKDAPVDLAESLKLYFEKERQQLERILLLGIANKQLYVEDTPEVARILMFCLIGLRIGILRDIKTSIFPSKAEFDYILDMQKKMLCIFIRGLSKG